jgi:hypothetical protein
MDQKSAPTNARPGPKTRTGRSKAASETARLFLDAEEFSRRVQSAPLSRYVE